MFPPQLTASGNPHGRPADPRQPPQTVPKPCGSAGRNRRSQGKGPTVSATPGRETGHCSRGAQCRWKGAPNGDQSMLRLAWWPTNPANATSTTSASAQGPVRRASDCATTRTGQRTWPAPGPDPDAAGQAEPGDEEGGRRARPRRRSRAARRRPRCPSAQSVEQDRAGDRGDEVPGRRQRRDEHVVPARAAESAPVAGRGRGHRARRAAATSAEHDHEQAHERPGRTRRRRRPGRERPASAPRRSTTTRLSRGAGARSSGRSSGSPARGSRRSRRGRGGQRPGHRRARGGSTGRSARRREQASVTRVGASGADRRRERQRDRERVVLVGPGGRRCRARCP